MCCDCGCVPPKSKCDRTNAKGPLKDSASLRQATRYAFLWGHLRVKRTKCGPSCPTYGPLPPPSPLPCGKIEINSWKMCTWKSPNEILLIAMENLLKLSHAPLTPASKQTYFKYRSKYYSVCFMCRCRKIKKNKLKQSEKNVSTKIKPTTANKMKNAGKNIAAK